MSDREKKESCPLCGAMINHPSNFDDVVLCKCGAALKLVVPLFKMSESGYIFRPASKQELSKGDDSND